MITGVYRFYQNGELVGESKNLITTAGKAVILDYFAGARPSIATCLAVGTSTTAAALTDSALGFEIDREAITSIGADTANSRIVFKATLAADLAGVINEVGAYTLPNDPSTAGYDSKFIFSMNSSELWSPNTFTTNNTRMSQSLHFNPAASATASADLTNATLDLSGYASTDRVALAGYVADSNCASVTIKLGSDSSNYTSYVFNSPAAGYQYFSTTKGAGAVTGTPDWTNINYIHIDVTAKSAGATAVDIDALRIEDSYTLSPLYSFVSHSILTTPVTKVAGVPMDIEYSMGLSL